MINVSQNRWLNLLAGLGVGACSATVGASPYDIADKPLFLSVSVPLNVALTRLSLFERIYEPSH